MSIRIVNRVLHHGPDEPHLRYVLMVLASHANDSGGAYPGIRLLARETALSDRTVQRTLKHLEKGGWIEVDRARGRGNRYLVNVRQLTQTDDAHVVSQPTQTDDAHVTGDTNDTTLANRRRPRHGGNDTHVVQLTTPTSSEPSRTVNEPPRPGVPRPNGRHPPTAYTEPATPPLPPEQHAARAAQARAALKVTPRQETP